MRDLHVKEAVQEIRQLPLSAAPCFTPPCKGWDQLVEVFPVAFGNAHVAAWPALLPTHNRGQRALRFVYSLVAFANQLAALQDCS